MAVMPSAAFNNIKAAWAEAPGDASAAARDSADDSLAPADIVSHELHCAHT